MKVTSTNISGLKIVQSKIYRDNRGLLKEVFKQKLFKNDDFISAANSYGVSKLTYGGSTDSFQLDISKIKRKINIDLDINKLKNILYEYCK